MSAEGGELTFVRCPSCRSLVPAVSTRCRWCGNSLGAANSSESAKEEAPSRRVRQKTRSIQAGEYVPQPTHEKGAQGFESSVQDDDYEMDDPLKGFIEEVEEEISDEEILSSLADVEEESKRAPNGVGMNGLSHLSDDSDAESVPLEGEYEEMDSEVELEEDLADEVNQGINRELEIQALESNKEFSGTKSSLQGAVMADEEPSQEAFQEPSQELPKSQEVKPQVQRFSQQRTPMHPKSSDLRVDIERAGEKSKESATATRTAIEGAKLGGNMNKTHYEAASGGKLFGWLVSYSTAEGQAFELREGRFFISGSALKGNDFVIKDPSVSTPHAMVNVARGGGFAIQDLMSDRGIFIRRKGQDTYQREDGIAKCSNGDWIRIGDVEYLLTVVADIVK